MLRRPGCEGTEAEIIAVGVGRCIAHRARSKAAFEDGHCKILDGRPSVQGMERAFAREHWLAVGTCQKHPSSPQASLLR